MTEDKQGRGGCGKLGESKCKGPGARASLLCVCAYVCGGGHRRRPGGCEQSVQGRKPPSEVKVCRGWAGSQCDALLVPLSNVGSHPGALLDLICTLKRSLWGVTMAF